MKFHAFTQLILFFNFSCSGSLVSTRASTPQALQKRIDRAMVPAKANADNDSDDDDDAATPVPVGDASPT